MPTMGSQEHSPVHGTCAIIVPPLLEPHHESRVRHLKKLNMTPSPVLVSLRVLIHF